MKPISRKTSPSRVSLTWNQKNLDYEIETGEKSFQAHQGEKAWNQKNLDYKIETSPIFHVFVECHLLEIKRTSITRLKQDRSLLRTADHKTWNQKNLDYEIETGESLPVERILETTWNQKNLDYEIETGM